MHKKLAVSLLLGVLGFLGIVARAADPVTIETSWVDDFYYTKCTGVPSCTADVAGLGAGVSISTQNVVGFSWSVLSNGADSTFTISQVTRTYPPVSITGSNPQSGANVNGPASGFNDTSDKLVWHLSAHQHDHGDYGCGRHSRQWPVPGIGDQPHISFFWIDSLGYYLFVGRDRPQEKRSVRIK